MSDITKLFAEVLDEYIDARIVAFDLDGCLVNEFFGLSDFLDTLRVRYNLNPYEIVETISLYEAWLSNREFDWIGGLLTLLGASHSCDKRSELDKFHLIQLYNSRRYPATCNLELHGFLSNLAKSRTLILVTNGLKSRQLSKIRALGISKYFKALYFCDDTLFPPKPNFCPLVDGQKIDVMIGDRVLDQEFAKANSARYVYLGDSFFRG